eukprot:scaffold3410_cov141-Cylindrotheca_fusiformis.AAC.1
MIFPHGNETTESNAVLTLEWSVRNDCQCFIKNIAELLVLLSWREARGTMAALWTCGKRCKQTIAVGWIPGIASSDRRRIVDLIYCFGGLVGFGKLQNQKETLLSFQLFSKIGC